MDELIAFLRARLDEDEQAARGATWHEDAGTWRAEPTPYETRGKSQRWYIEDSMDDGVVSHVDPQASDDEGVARHIARHHPARVLRDLEAKRRLLAWLQRTQDWAASNNLWTYDETEPLKILAAPYVDHPEFREEWRTSTS
ncbi:DUF6221 family protein [Acrocarpospora sp. B8E8]|uniref:DUF6221 family protein n=1 Tax=Acrocarpospora sp. B8E8 TaxID=3153572 RepID=UPI00325F7AB7